MKQQQRVQNVTISIPKQLNRELHLYVEKRGLSRFITEAIEEKLSVRKASLEEQYAQAAKDEEANREFREWEDTMIGDGLNETNDW